MNDPSSIKNEMWCVVAMRQTSPSAKPITHTTWHPTKASAILYAESVERRSGEVKSIQGYSQIEAINWKKHKAAEADRHCS